MPDGVEARESLVDWNHIFFVIFSPFSSRGSWEPCGLKYWRNCKRQGGEESRLVRALWIEMRTHALYDRTAWSRLVRALWIEINRVIHIPGYGRSRLVRALWIEIGSTNAWNICTSVEARESLVDWNHDSNGIFILIKRRGSWEPCGLKCWCLHPQLTGYPSRLVRAVWIEIGFYLNSTSMKRVEARESLVDWNSTTGSWKHLCRLYIFTTHLEILYNSQCYKENIFKREGESCYGKRY